MGACPTIRHQIKRVKDGFAHAVKIADNVQIANVQHFQVQPVQSCIALEIRQNIMRVAIHFDNQTLLRTKEIGNERPDHTLTTEFMAI